MPVLACACRSFRSFTELVVQSVLIRAHLYILIVLGSHDFGQISHPAKNCHLPFWLFLVQKICLKNSHLVQNQKNIHIPID